MAMNDESTLEVPLGISINLPIEQLRGKQGDKGDKGDDGKDGGKTISGMWLPKLTLNGQDIALAYTSRVGISRQPDGVMHLWGNIQFNGLMPIPDSEWALLSQNGRGTPLIFWLPVKIAVAAPIITIGTIGYTSNKWTSDSAHPAVPAFACRGGGGNAWCYIDGLPIKGGNDTNPTQLALSDLNPHSQLNFWLSYPID